MSYLFKQNLTLKAKQQYTGNWAVASKIFILYEYLADPRNSDLAQRLDLERIGYVRDLNHLWVAIYREHLKHLNLDRKLILEISKTLKLVSPYYMSTYSDRDINKILKLHRLSKYKEMIQNLISYLTSFFKELGINIKPIKITSEITGSSIYAITTNLDPSEEYIEEQININNVIQEKILKQLNEKYKQTNSYIKNIGQLFFNIKNSGDIYQITGNENNQVQGYILPGEWDKVYSPNDLPLLEQKIKKNTLIEDNYSKLIYEKGQLLTTQGTPIKQLDFLPPNKIEKKLEDYQETIDAYNATLKTYEPKLSNMPRTITLGDHTLTVQKVFDKNITRPIIIEGKYMGVYLDQMVASNGQVIESVKGAGHSFSQTKDLYESVVDSKIVKPKDVLNLEHSVITHRIKDYTPENYLYGESFLLEDEYGDPMYDEDEGYQIEKNFSSLKIPAVVKNDFFKLTGFNLVGDIYEGQYAISIIDENKSEYGSRYTIRTNDDALFSVSRTVKLDENNKPEYIKNEAFFTPKCIPDGLGTKVLAQQIKAASNAKFKFLKTEAAGSFRSTMIGYYVWPKLGYYNDSSLTYGITGMKAKAPKEFAQVQDWFTKTLNVDITEDKIILDWNILDLYACKVDGRFLGQELWQKYGSNIYCEFDLTPGSLSMRVFNRYVQLKAKKEGIPIEDFLKVDLSKYTKLVGLKCLLSEYNGTSEYRDEIRKAISVAINNHENGEILHLLKNPALIQSLKSNYITTSEQIEQLRALSKTYRTDLKYKFASEKDVQEDPIFRELDMRILDQVWNEVNNDYESGNI